MSEYVVRDDQPVPVVTKPIERKHGVTFIGGTTVRTKDVWDTQQHSDHNVYSLAHLFKITPEQATFALKYEQKRAKRKDPVKRQLRRNGQACKSRGRAFEHYLATRLERFGFKRVPGSGMFGGELSGDIRRASKLRSFKTEGPLVIREASASVHKIEAKRMEREQRFYRAALAQGGGSQVAIVGKLGLEPIAFMELSQLERLLWEAGYEVTE